MDRAPDKGSDGSWGRPPLSHWRDNHTFAFLVNWSEEEGKFVVTLLDLSVQRSNIRVTATNPGTPSAPGVAAVGPMAIAEAVAEAIADALAETVHRNNQDDRGDVTKVPPADRAPTSGSCTQPGEEFGFPNRVLCGSPPFSKIRELREGCSGVNDPNYSSSSLENDASSINELDSAELELLEILCHEEMAAANLINLSGGDLGSDEEIEMEIEFTPESDEEGLFPFGTSTPGPDTGEGEPWSSWTGYFSFQDLVAIHEQLVASNPNIGSCLPAFLEEPTGDWAPPSNLSEGTGRRHLDCLCSQLQVYLDYALEIFGWKVLYEVLFKEAVDTEENLPQEPPTFYLLIPYENPLLKLNCNVKNGPDSGGGANRGPGGGPGGAPGGGPGGAHGDTGGPNADGGRRPDGDPSRGGRGDGGDGGDGGGNGGGDGGSDGGGGATGGSDAANF